jgi:ADP-ribosylglycohydrolase
MQDKYRGCMAGLAAGDALGAPVEFMDLKSIRQRYGEEGIKDYDGWGGFEAGSYTDDTQMSLSTAWGCIKAFKGGRVESASLLVYDEYLRWLQTQERPEERRYPGGTCLNALKSGIMGTIEDPINNSKGCGGVMRTAPAGLAFHPGMAFRQGAEYGAITHGHPSGYLSSGFLSEMISWIIAGVTLLQAVQLAKTELVRYKGFEETLDRIALAESLAAENRPDEDSIRMIGEGWVGEEALAISIYCALKHPGSWEKGVLSSINHSGDSDSTGSITGAILGTFLGMQAIPTRWVAGAENSEMLIKTADELYSCTNNNR